MVTVMTNKLRLIQMRKRLTQNRKAFSFFATKEALRLEGSPESRKASKAMNVQYHGSRFSNAGDFFVNKPLTAR